MSVRIFAMTHKKFEEPQDPMYIPLHVGHKQAKEDFGYIGDDTGNHISDLNCYYAELSGLYWVWKNYHDADYVGLCHYRRFLTNEEGYAFTEKQYESLLQEYDIITTKELELPNSYYYGFGAHHRIQTLEETGKILQELYPEYAQAFWTLVHQNKTYFGNMMVADKALFDEYAKWLFSIFFVLQERIDLTFEDDYHKRVFGFISEFLLYVWVRVKGLKAMECRVAIIGEKMETRELKQQMAVYFQKKDMLGAKEYFAQYLKVRPDVLMEASDITGECKLCLQAVSTANLEQQQYGGSFIEGRNTYARVIAFLRRLNEIANRGIQDSLTEQDRQWLVEEQVSDIAIQAALRIYAGEGEQAAAWERIKSITLREAI